MATRWDHPVDPEFWETLPYRQTPEWLIDKWYELADEDVKDRVNVQPSGCWIGKTDRRTRNEYAVYRGVRLWRYVYELLVEPVPEGLVLDHLCYVKRCCNPFHLEPVTNTENAARWGILDLYEKMRDAEGFFNEDKRRAKYESSLAAFRAKYY